MKQNLYNCLINEENFTISDFRPLDGGVYVCVKIKDLALKHDIKQLVNENIIIPLDIKNNLLTQIDALDETNREASVSYSPRVNKWAYMKFISENHYRHEWITA